MSLYTMHPARDSVLGDDINELNKKKILGDDHQISLGDISSPSTDPGIRLLSLHGRNPVHQHRFVLIISPMAY